MTKIKLLIADDHAILRDGISAMLRMVNEIQIVGEASNGLEAIDGVQTHQPDIVLMDFNMPEMNGLEALKNIALTNPDVKVILFTMEIRVDIVSEALAHGVKGYIPKDVRKLELVNAIKRVSDGEEYFAPKVSEVIFKDYHRKKTQTSSVIPGSGKISKREEEVLTMIGLGIGNKEIAEKLFISVRTVGAHRDHIMKKMGLKNSVELIKFGISTGIIPMNYNQ
jgi:DNA-binding NarL/FixJ family response regulator